MVTADTAGPVRRRTSAGQLVAVSGAVITLASMFLPWYSVSMRIRSYADLSMVAMARIDSGGMVCSPPSGHGCHVSAQVGALTGGIWDWRTLIAVGAASVLVLVVARATRPGPGRAQPARWRLLAGCAVATTVLVVAALVISPVSAAGQPGRPGPPAALTSSLSYGAIVALAGSLIALGGALLTAPWAGRPARPGAGVTAPGLPAPGGPA